MTILAHNNPNSNHWKAEAMKACAELVKAIPVFEDFETWFHHEIKITDTYREIAMKYQTRLHELIVSQSEAK